MKNGQKQLNSRAKVVIYAKFLRMRVVFKGGYYSYFLLQGAGTIRGRVLIKGGNYLRNYGSILVNFGNSNKGMNSYTFCHA